MIFDINGLTEDTIFQSTTTSPELNNKDLIQQGDPVQLNPDPRLQAAVDDIDKYKQAYKLDLNEEVGLDTSTPFKAILNFDTNSALPVAENTMQGIDEPGKTLPENLNKPSPDYDTAKSQWYLEIPKAITAIQYVGNNIQAMEDFCNNGRYRITQLENGALMLADSERNTVINPGDFVASLKSGFSVYKADDFIKDFRYIERDSDAAQTNPQVNQDTVQQEELPPEMQEPPIQDENYQQFFSALVGNVAHALPAISSGIQTVNQFKDHVNNKVRSSKMPGVLKYIDMFKDNEGAMFSNSTILYDPKGAYHLKVTKNFSENEEEEEKKENFITEGIRDGVSQVAREGITYAASSVANKLGEGIGYIKSKLSNKHPSFDLNQIPQIQFSNQDFKKLCNYSMKDKIMIELIRKDPDLLMITNKDFEHALDTEKGIHEYEQLDQDVNRGLLGELDIFKDDPINQKPTNLDIGA